MNINFDKNHSSGTDENESKIERKSKHKTKETPRKNFMAPTISARSKSISPKKRVLTEWNEDSTTTHHQKSSNLGKKLSFNKLGVSKNSIPKVPTLPSSVLNDKNDENVEIDDAFVVPYDPLTNYLSPRPKFLRYNPSRHRNQVVCDDGSDNSISTSRVSVDSLSSCAGKNCLIEEKVADHDGAEVIDDVYEEEEEEEVIEERKWSLKWEVVKCLMVFCVLVVSSMYVTSMNLNVPLFDDDHKYGNITSGVVSMFEIDRISVESDKMIGFDVVHENEIGISEVSNLVVQSETSSLVDLEPKCQVGEIFAHVFFEGLEEKNVDFEAKSNEMDFELENEEENVDDEPQFEAGLVSEEVNVKIELMDEDVDFEKKSNNGGLELENEVNVVAYEVDNVDDEPQFDPEVVGEETNGEIRLVDEDETVPVVGDVDFEAEVFGEEARGEVKLNDEDETVTLVGEEVVEYEHNEITLHNTKSVVLVLILSLMTLVVSFLLKLFYKCKKASLKTTMSSNVKKLCSQQETNKQKLPPKVVEQKLKPIQIGNSCLDSLSIARLRNESAEVTPLPPTRVIPKVKLLSEFDLVGEARSSLHRCDMSSKKEEERMMVNKRSEFDTPSSHLQPSNVCNEISSNEHGKEETMSKANPTPLRRSTRLCSRGVTSP